MQKILYLIPSLEYTGLAKQATLAAAGLALMGYQIRVCVLGGKGPLERILIQPGIPLDSLGWTRPWQPPPYWSLRRIIRKWNPHIIHAWGLTAGILGAPLWRKSPATLAISSIGTRDKRAHPLLLYWLAGKAQVVIYSTQKEKENLEKIGVAGDRLVHLPLAVEDCKTIPGVGLRKRLGIAEGVPLIMCIGPLHNQRGIKEAIWSLDILQFLFEDIQLVIVGEGADRPRLERFTQLTEAHNRVHFLGAVQEVGPLLAEADVVWTPCLRPGSQNVLLEAMAAGKPFVASNWPDLSNLAPPELQHCFVPPGDKAALARQTRILLEDPERRRILGEAGRRHVRENHSVAKMTDSLSKAYKGLEP